MSLEVLWGSCGVNTSHSGSLLRGIQWPRLKNSLSQRSCVHYQGQPCSFYETGLEHEQPEDGWAPLGCGFLPGINPMISLDRIGCSSG